MGFGDDYRAFVAAHPGASLWHDPDFLTALAPPQTRGAYHGVVLRDASGTVTAAVPVYRKRRLDGLVATVPPLGRYADPLTAAPPGRGGEAQAVAVLREAWRGCVSVDHVLSPRATALLAPLRQACPGLRHRERTTYLASVADGMEPAWRAVAKGKRRQLRRAEAYWTLGTSGLTAEVLEVLRTPFRRQGLAVPYSEDVLRAVARDLAPGERFRVHTARHPDGVLGAAGVAVADGETVYALVSGSTAAARGHDGGSLMLWRHLRFAAATGRSRVDFLGSDLEGPGRNRRELGGRAAAYAQVWWDQRAWTRGLRWWRGGWGSD